MVFFLFSRRSTHVLQPRPPLSPSPANSFIRHLPQLPTGLIVVKLLLCSPLSFRQPLQQLRRGSNSELPPAAAHLLRCTAAFGVPIFSSANSQVHLPLRPSTRRQPSTSIAVVTLLLTSQPQLHSLRRRPKLAATSSGEPPVQRCHPPPTAAAALPSPRPPAALITKLKTPVVNFAAPVVFSISPATATNRPVSICRRRSSPSSSNGHTAQLLTNSPAATGHHR